MAPPANIIRASGTSIPDSCRDNTDPKETERLFQSRLHFVWWREQGTFAAGVSPADHKRWWYDYGNPD
jgi:hypothetical protein